MFESAEPTTSVRTEKILERFYRRNLVKIRGKLRAVEPLSINTNPRGFDHSNDVRDEKSIKVAIYHSRYYALIEEGDSKNGPHVIRLIWQARLSNKDHRGLHVLVARRRMSFNFLDTLEVMCALETTLQNREYKQTPHLARARVDIDLSLDRPDMFI